MDYATVYLIAALVVLVIHIILAYQARKIAEAKGHDGSTWGILCFLTGFGGCILVAALPDKKQMKREEEIADTLDVLLTAVRNQQRSPVPSSSGNKNSNLTNSALNHTEKQPSSPSSQFHRIFTDVSRSSSDKNSDLTNSALNHTEKQPSSPPSQSHRTFLPAGKWVCGKCNTTNPENTMFCSHCGEMDSRIKTWS